MRKGSFVLVLGLAIPPLQATAVGSAWELRQPVSRAVLQDLPARSAWVVSADFEALRTDSGLLRMEFPFGAREVVALGLEQHAQGRYTWRGSLEGSEDHTVVLSVAGDAMAGFVSAPEGIWELVPSAAAGQSWLIELDEARLPPCPGPVVPEPVDDSQASAAAGASARPSSPRDSGERVDVLVMYSPAARDAAGGVNQITAQAQAAVDSANTVFANSGMRMRFRAVGIELLEGWVEGSTSASTELGNFRSNATQQARRNALAADMVSLLVANLPSACGIGYVMRSPGAGFAGSAVQITDRDCAVGNLSWAHEHGHNLGFEHDPANGTAPASASFPWSFGHYVEGQGSQSYRTVMSYQCPLGGCTRRPYFSNPRVSFNGFPTGLVDERDNARSGDAIADITANFRLEQDWTGFADGFEAVP